MQKIDIGTDIDLQSLLVNRMLIQANSGGGKSVLARKIIEKTYGLIPFIVMDCDGEYYTLKEKLDDVIIIGGHAADIPISMQSVKLLPREIIGNRLSVVIDLSELKMTERIRYVRLFLETMMELPKTYWVPYLVFLEEVHKFCGEQDKQESGPAVRDLMSRGRKMGYCGILITQRISKLHKDAAAEVNNKFVGRTNLDIDMDRAARELGFTSSSEYTRLSLRDLAPGHFYAYGTSIEPHHVHEVIIKMPETSIPKAGAIVDIKPRKPTEKLLAALSKLSQLPAAAEKELKDIASLQAEVKRLTGELAKAKKRTPAAPTYPHLNEKQAQQAIDRVADKVRAETSGHYRGIIRQKDAAIKKMMASIQTLNKILMRIKEISVPLAISPTTPLNETTPAPKETISHISEATSAKSEKKFPEIEKNFQKSGKSFQHGEKLGKCARAILSFLAGYSDRDFTKAQVGIATGYSPVSGGFNNTLAELNTKGLIVRENGTLRVYTPAIPIIENLIGSIEPMNYNIETFKENLSKCEREIYEVLLASPHDAFSKEELAEATPSKYSSGSGGFNNALSRLNTLELIRRDKGTIMLNPELIELL